MDSPEKLGTLGTQNEEKQSKNTPLCANKHKDVNYTSALLQKLEVYILEYFFQLFDRFIGISAVVIS